MLCAWVGSLSLHPGRKKMCAHVCVCFCGCVPMRVCVHACVSVRLCGMNTLHFEVCCPSASARTYQQVIAMLVDGNKRRLGARGGGSPVGATATL